MDMVLAETTEETDGSGSGVEVGNFVVRNGLPVAGRGRVNGGGLKDSGGDTIEKGSVDDITGESVRSKELLVQNTEPTCDR